MLSEKQALDVLKTTAEGLPSLLETTEEIRRKRSGNKVTLCSIVNAKSGSCSEDCTFCAQSAHYTTSVESYPLLSNEQLLAAYRKASAFPIRNFGIVTSGKSVTETERERLCTFISGNRSSRVPLCASLGTATKRQLTQLKNAGLKRYHHNLETSASFFPNICTTHRYEDRLKTVQAAKETGLSVCCGGIFGLGENEKERVALAFALRKLAVDSIPLNFFIPVEGTPASDFSVPLDAPAILKTIAMFSMVNPQAEIKVCAGREHFLGEDEKEIFRAGASGMMTGNYLTVKGRTVAQDLSLLEEAGMEP